MAVNFVNNWKNILDKIESVLESEFKGTLPVYVGNPIPKGVNQAIELIPTGSVLLDYNATSETREFSITFRFVFAEVNLRENVLKHILRYVMRIEALIHDNISMTYVNEKSQNDKIFNCRFESTNLDAVDEPGIYVTEWDFKCQHLGNIS
ncbi:MAG: hypothetical protein GOVbin1434_30 [Prokaryotic dsDNA virus sp.]|nr:MAG: hypothetical protein GOVbin1434_30 [Prokaryotic dsDNA virus sp.]|tara:strand:+ start:4275 stop:4724 length:450 start_codon:yes stop_codon:yes gene_type:complete